MQYVLIGWLLALQSAWALDELSMSPSIELKQALAPVVQAALDPVCGGDCPGFQIDPVLEKTAKQASTDDLGFSPRAAKGHSVASVAIRVLVKGSAGKELQESIRKTVAFRAANAVDVPVTVRLEVLPPIAETKADKPGLSLAQLKPLVWPLALILSMAMGLFALLLVLRHQMRVLGFVPASGLAPKLAAPSFEKERAVLDSLLANRKGDIAWLVESAAGRGDAACLEKVVQAYPADALSRAIDFNAFTLEKLAALRRSGSSAPLDQLAVELTKAVDEAHWSRIRDEKTVVGRTGRFSSSELASALKTLSAAESRAYLLANIDKEKWAVLLSVLDSKARIEIGGAMAALSGMSSAQIREIEHDVETALQSVAKQGSRTAEKASELVQDYSLYLSEEEGQNLWLRLSAEKAKGTRPARLESTLLDLSEEALLDLCLRLDLESLKATVRCATQPVRDRILRLLPDKLKQRLVYLSAASAEQASSDADWIRARANLAGWCREKSAQ